MNFTVLDDPLKEENKKNIVRFSEQPVQKNLTRRVFFHPVGLRKTDIFLKVALYIFCSKSIDGYLILYSIMTTFNGFDVKMYNYDYI